MARTQRPESVIRKTKRQHLRRDPNALVASASIMTGPKAGKAKMSVEQWQNEAWKYYDEIGELRFGVGWLANALSRVNLIAALPPASQGDEPTPVDLTEHPALAEAVALVNEIAGGVAGQGQLLAGITKQLSVPGVGYILATADDETDSFSTWSVLSNEEAKKSPGSTAIQVTNSESGEWEDLAEDDLLIKVWHSHPRRRHEPDSPTRACLGPLNEIKMASQRIVAECRSRLAGNGLLVIPSEVEFPPGQGNVTGGDGDADEFIETFIQVTQIPITDQSSPAADTPLVMKVPGEFVKDVQHITFFTDLNSALGEIRNAAIKRLALGLDLPPEVLLGMGGINHWGAWQIAEEAITMQVEPLAETICHALTIGFLRPALEDAGLDPKSIIVWYDTSDLSTKLDLSAAAGEAHARGVISDAAYLGYLGLDVGDLPEDDEYVRRLLVEIAKAVPELTIPILTQLGYITPEAAAALAPVPSAGAPVADPVEADAPVEGPPDAQAASAVVLAAADGLVVRALERAGSRLRSAAGKQTTGGAAAIPCPDPSVLHCAMSATEYASLDHLLDGAWERVPAVAVRLGMEPLSLAACLDGYVRGLIAAGHAHEYDRLADALGVTDDRHLITAS